MKYTGRSITGLLLGALSFGVLADTQDEINHLLDYVENTDCQYERNGKMHSGPEGREHITKKYNYYEDDIETAEDFIRLSATQSLMSKKRYWIHCPDQEPVYSSDWLLEELDRFRESEKQS